jgi:hypothetical protein
MLTVLEAFIRIPIGYCSVKCCSRHEMRHRQNCRNVEWQREIYCRRTESRESSYKFGTVALATAWHKNCVIAEIKLYRTYFRLSLKYSRTKFHGFQHLYFKKVSNSVTLNVSNAYASSQWVRNIASHSIDTLFESQTTWLRLFHL